MKLDILRLKWVILKKCLQQYLVYGKCSINVSHYIIFITLNIGNVSPLSASILILPQLVQWVRLERHDKGQFRLLGEDKVTCQGPVNCWSQKGDGLLLLYLLHLNNRRIFGSSREAEETPLLVCVLAGAQAGRKLAHVVFAPVFTFVFMGFEVHSEGGRE